jgi:hypothetical protein
MTQLDVKLAALRARRRSPGFVGWIRRYRPFDRRSIRQPADRDAYWATVRRRLAESDAASLMRRADEPPARRALPTELVDSPSAG